MGFQSEDGVVYSGEVLNQGGGGDLFSFSQIMVRYVWVIYNRCMCQPLISLRRILSLEKSCRCNITA